MERGCIFGCVLFSLSAFSLKKDVWKQIVYSDNSWRNILNCWRRVREKLLKNWGEREGVFLFRLRMFVFGGIVFNVVKNLEYIHALCIRDPSSLRSSGWHCTLWFFLVLKIHVTHCTSSVIRWISMCPSAMCLFFTCHWCHLAGSSDISDKRFFLSLHGEALIISELYASCNECNEFSNVEKNVFTNF